MFVLPHSHHERLLIGYGIHIQASGSGNHMILDLDSYFFSVYGGYLSSKLGSSLQHSVRTLFLAKKREAILLGWDIDGAPEVCEYIERMLSKVRSIYWKK